MAKLKLLQQTGTILETSDISFEISDLLPNQILSKIENITHSTNAIIDFFYTDEKTINGSMDMNIPQGVSQSSISIFAYIEELQKDGSSKLAQICPTVFYISEIKINFEGKVTVDPSFINAENTTAIKYKGKPNSRFLFSINDKRLPLFSNPNGDGSVHFVGKDLLTNDINTVQEFPIYCYSSNDNYSSKEFTGSFLTIMPSDFKVTAQIDTDVDPRCLLNTPWVIPDSCIQPPPPVEPLEPEIPVNGVPTKECSAPCTDNIWENFEVLTETDKAKICKINNNSSTLLHNGMILHSYVSVDKTATTASANFNITNVCIAKDQSAINKPILAARNVKVAPLITAGASLQIYVDEDIANKITHRFEASPTPSGSNTSVYAVIFQKDLVNLNLNIRSVEEDNNSNDWIITTEPNKVQKTFSEWLNCQYVVFFEDLSTATIPDINISDITQLPSITDTTSGVSIPVSTLNAVISCNPDYITETDEYDAAIDGVSYVYVIAEAMINNQIQLFFYSFSIGNEDWVTRTFGWKQLTFEGENKNPKTVVDQFNNLHIVWESDRTGELLLYYGIIGPSSISMSNATLSSLIDKQAELQLEMLSSSSSSSSSSLFPTDILVPVDTYYFPITDFTQDWSSSTSGDGTINSSGTSFIISGTPIDDVAFMWSRLNKTNNTDFAIDSGLFSQVNYQISFDAKLSVTQETDYLSKNYLLSTVEQQQIYDNWQSSFTLNTELSTANQPIYTKDGNDFALGFVTGVYDKFIPLVGSYKITDTSTFQIIASGDNANLRPFMMGIIPERIRFKATNILSQAEFSLLTDDVFISGEEHEVFTGKAKLVIIYNTYKQGGSNSYTIIRNISDNYDLWSNNSFEIMVHYSKMSKEDIASYLCLRTANITDAKYICNLTILSGLPNTDTNPVFSESFITNLENSTDETHHRAFDIGFGIPLGGQYLSKEYMPYNSSIFERNLTTITLDNISFTSPKYTYDTNICNIHSSNLDLSNITVVDAFQEFEEKSFFDTNTLLSLGLTTIDSSEFTQIPIALYGMNKSSNICLGNSNDVHIVWQSNRDNYWNIYTTNSYERNLPFRKETQITDTESNSLSPDISISKNGTRMIVWHDNRNGKYEIFGARSFDGYLSNETLCRTISDNVYNGETNCTINISFVTGQSGYSAFTMMFYFNEQLTQLYKSISTIGGGDNLDNWTVGAQSMATIYVDNTLYEGIPVVAGQVYTISYTPSTEDLVFDRPLYVKLVSHNNIIN